jgi:hypothetical protein
MDAEGRATQEHKPRCRDSDRGVEKRKLTPPALRATSPIS